jgi:glycosyltransferase involved in cell wall biosynthesis
VKKCQLSRLTLLFINRMAKVLVDLHRIGGNKYNGLYHFCEQLGRHLITAPASGAELFYYVPEKQFDFFGSQVKYVKQKSIDKIYRFGTSQFDVWHIATTISWYRPFNRKTKTIFTIHDLNFLNEEEYSASSKKKYLQLIQQRVDRAHHLTFISEFTRKQAQENLYLGNKPGTVIYNGCNMPADLNFSEPTSKPQRAFLFTIGQLHSRKNFHVLPSLLVGNDYELVIAGLNDFPYTQKVLAEAKRHGVESRVKLIGAITDAEKYWYYKNCLAFVFPSIGEGFGLPVLEAMQFGKPVFLSTHTSLPEIGGDAAFYFNDFSTETMNAALEKGLNDFNTNNGMAKVIAQAAKFSWDKAAHEYLQLYSAV